MGLNLDFISTKAKPKQCETTVEQQTPSDSENNTCIEEVTEFTYMGAKVTKDGQIQAEIKTRPNKARGVFAVLRNIWKTNKISKKIYAFSRSTY